VVKVCDTKYCYNDTIVIVINPMPDSLIVLNENFIVKKGNVLSNTNTLITKNDNNVDGGIMQVLNYYKDSISSTSIDSFIVITGNLGVLTVDKSGVFTYQSNKGLGDDVFIFDVCSNGICMKDTLIITVYGVPTGFSPNGDNINDNYEIVYPKDWGSASLQVYNRWGSLVYELDNYKDEWNGTSNRGVTIGNELPDGTYFVDIKYADKPEFNEVIYITLLR
jgi:gliding motility-associated-like protein